MIMDEQSRRNRQGKIVQFPNLKKRLIEEGMLALQNKQFQNAYHFLSDARELDPFNPEITIGIVLCLIEMGDLQEAKQTCKKILQEDIGDYFHVLQIYLTILIQLREYNEVTSTIEAVLEENHIPSQYAENFYQLLDFSRKMNEDSRKAKVDVSEENNEIHTAVHKINEGTLNDQYRTIQSLKDYRIQPILKALKDFLIDPEKHPVLKTMILQLLIERGVEEETIVEKFGQTLTIHPKTLENTFQDQSYGERVLQLVENNLGNNNPTLFELLKDLWYRHLYVLFPFHPEPEDPKQWAAALHIVGYEFHSMNTTVKEIIQMYDINQSQLTTAMEKIKKIEEISFLQM